MTCGRWRVLAGLWIVGVSLAPGLLLSFPARAALTDKRLALFLEAASSAAEMDAMDAHCKVEQKGEYARQIVAGSVRQKADAEQTKQVEERAARVRAESAKKLQVEKPDCRSVEFMFRKYALLDTLDRQIKALVDGWVAPGEEAKTPTRPPGAF